MKKFINIITLLSLLFLAYYLYKSDILHLPIIYNYSDVLLSFLCLFAGFVAQVYTWKSTVAAAGYAIDSKVCFVGTGLSVFAKYIPGKVMVIVGRAAFVADKYGYSLEAMSALSLTTQLITLWVGLSVGALGLVLAGGYAAWTWLTLGLWAALTVAVFSNWVNHLLAKILQYFLKRSINLPHLTYKQVGSGLHWYVLNWLFWAAGFYFLCAALTTQNVPLVAGLGYPLAITLGIAAMLTPGGLGVREGMIVIFLKLLGFDLATATTISVASRLWFLVGEVFIFVLGGIVKRTSG